jgi:uncharacterized protein
VAQSRKPAKGAARPAKAKTAIADGYQNFQTRTGLGTGNLSDGGSYGLNPITRQRVQLEYMYRGSWIAGVAVDAPAEDMTREGIEFNGIEPDEREQMHEAYANLHLLPEIGDGIRWSNLYGGCIVAMLIEGQDMATPLRPETIRQDQFKGLLAIDRWQLMPTLGEVVLEYGPHFGKPKYYQVVTNTVSTGTSAVNPLMGQKIHYSRVFRFEGQPLPFYQRQAENGWGMSRIERLYDRMVAFDSATLGAAQLVFKAHLRTVYIEGLTKIIAAGGPGLTALNKRMEEMRRWQQSEGIWVLDAGDKFDTSTAAMSGLSEVLSAFSQQISGAMEVPLVRLLGQSPAGLNSSGESDLRTYYDGTRKKQKRDLTTPITVLNEVVYRSTIGKEPPKGWGFEFNPLWQLSATERSGVAGQVTSAVTTALGESVIDRATALKELRASSKVTGVFTNITDDAIKQAESDPPPVSELTPQQLIAQAKEQEAGAKVKEAGAGEKPNVQEPAKAEGEE